MPLKVEFRASKRRLFSCLAITQGSGQKVKKKTPLNIDFSLDDGHLDKGEVTLSNVLVTKERQVRVKSCLKVQWFDSRVQILFFLTLYFALHTDVTRHKTHSE